jgi:uncharacterized membrane protein YuzA (DUF378 family)
LNSSEGYRLIKILKRYLEIFLIIIFAINTLILGLIKIGLITVVPGSALQFFAGGLILLAAISDIGWRIYLHPSISKNQRWIRPILNLFVMDLIKITEKPVRCNIMWPRGIFTQKLKIEYYSDEFDRSKDIDIILEKWQGCSGMAWGYNQKMVAKPKNIPEDGQASWSLTPEMVKMTEEIAMIVSIPIHPNKQPHKIACILNFDSTEEIPSMFDKDSDASKQVDAYAEIIQSILHENDLL